FRRTRRELGDPDHRALAVADIVVALDETGALGIRRGAFRVVDRHRIGRPDFAARNVGPRRRADPGHDLVSGDDSVTDRVMAGDDAAYLQCHVVLPVPSLATGGAAVHPSRRGLSGAP